MSIIVIEPPKPIISKDEAKKHLRVEHSDDDLQIEGLIQAATAWLDGPDGWLGRALGEQTLQLSGWFSCRTIELPCPPIIGEIEVVTEDRDGNQQTADPATYRLSDGRLLVEPGASWVTRHLHIIRYKAGYVAPDPDDETQTIPSVPPPIKVAIMMLVAQWYQIREPISIGATVEHLPFAVEALLSPYRTYR
jgi:uncharacterized phiE125 gp8 family phage protein